MADSPPLQESIPSPANPATKWDPLIRFLPAWQNRWAEFKEFTDV